MKLSYAHNFASSQKDITHRVLRFSPELKEIGGMKKAELLDEVARFARWLYDDPTAGGDAKVDVVQGNGWSMVTATALDFIIVWGGKK